MKIVVARSLLISLFFFGAAQAAAGGGAGSTGGYWIAHHIDPQTGRCDSGDGQTGIVNRALDDPLLVQITGPGGEPIRGLNVYFEQVVPEPRYLGEAVTGPDGVAQIIYRPTGEAVVHSVTARIDGAVPGRDSIVFTFPIHEPTWVFFMLVGLAGGLAFFLFGMNLASSALQRAAGGRMRAILGTLTKNKYLGVAVGAVLTVLVQSSSATTVMLVSFVRAGLMSFGQTLGVILGADIGTTVTAQIIAFKLTDYALLIVAIGFGIRFLGKNVRLRNGGDGMLGFGILFFGLHIMSESMTPLRTYPAFLDALVGLENPLLGVLIGTLFTTLIQSSAAFIGLVLVLAQQGFLTLDAGIPLIFGANIGTCITAVLAALDAGREAKRVALAHVTFKVVGVAIFVWWIHPFANLIDYISTGGAGHAADPETLARVIPRQIANAHTVFNVGLTLIFLPITGPMAKMITRLLPDRPEPERPAKFRPRYLEDDLLTTPTLALNLAKVEILRMGDMTRTMARKILEPFLEDRVQVLDEIHEMEEEIDILDEAISKYLVEIGKQKISEDQTREVYLMMHVTKQFEHIADIVDKDLRPLAMRKTEGGIQFSASGRAEVEVYHLKMIKQISRALVAFKEGSLERARKMTEKQERYVHLAGDYEQAHFERLRNAVRETVASSEIHLELVDCLRRINSNTDIIARAMLMEMPRLGAEKTSPGDPGEAPRSA